MSNVKLHEIDAYTMAQGHCVFGLPDADDMVAYYMAHYAPTAAREDVATVQACYDAYKKRRRHD